MKGTDRINPSELVRSASHLEKLLDATVEIRLNPEAVERAYMARQLVQCTLPHSDPGNVPVWTRTNGKLMLAIRPYVDLKTRKAMYPYGTIPRLLLFWMVTEATQKKTRTIKLGNSLDAFMREIGLNPRTGGGKRGDAARLHIQMERLFRATVTFEDNRETQKAYVDMQVTSQGMLWWDPKRSRQDNLWESWVVLGEDFYEAITAAPVPVDLRALRALKRSPLALDLYAWLTYTTFSVSQRHASRMVPWEGLHAQMGAEYAEIRQFRAKVLATLKKIRLVYPALKVEGTPAGLVIHPSTTAIPSTRAKMLSSRPRWTEDLIHQP
jgi:Plasmid encoded RepA protein